MYSDSSLIYWLHICQVMEVCIRNVECVHVCMYVCLSDRIYICVSVFMKVILSLVGVQCFPLYSNTTGLVLIYY